MSQSVLGTLQQHFLFQMGALAPITLTHSPAVLDSHNSQLPSGSSFYSPGAFNLLLIQKRKGFLL